MLAEAAALHRHALIHRTMGRVVAGSLLLLLLPPPLGSAVSGSRRAVQDGRRTGVAAPRPRRRPQDRLRRLQTPPPGSDFDAYRLEAVIDAPPAVVAAAARADMADPAAAPANSEKTVLRDEGDEVVVYTYADLPMVSDRDVITHARQSFDAQSGTHRLEWRATDEGGPAPKEGVVRIEQSSGSWTFSPLDGGRTRAVYENHSDLAGSIPAWVINPLMTEAVVDGLVRLRARVGRDAGGEPRR